MQPPRTFDGIWLEDSRLTLRHDISCPDCGTGEALLAPRLAGICGTDLELTRGYYPYTGVPGHEFVAQVLSCPTAPGLEGRRVVGGINAPCGACPTCLAGRPTHCPGRTVLGIVNRPGVFARRFALPAANLLPVPDHVSDEAAVFTEPLAAALQILEQVEIGPGHRVCLVGAGRLGQLIARVLHLTGCQLTVLERSPAARALLEQAGIPCGDPPDDGWADLVVEASGSPAGFELARRLVRPRGTIVAKSTYHGKLEIDYSALVVDEITLVGSRCGPMDKALALLVSGEIDPAPLIQARFPLEQGIEAFQRAAKPAAMKVLLDFRKTW